MKLSLLSMLLFFLSFLGMVINSSNIIIMLMCMEIMLMSISLNIMFNLNFNELIMSHIYFLYITSMAAMESAMGLSMMVSFYKLKGSLSMKLLNLLKG